MLKKALVVILVMIGTGSLMAQREKFTIDELEHIEKTWTGLVKTNTGIRTKIISPGIGNSPKPGDEVVVLYRGWLFDGTLFDEQTNPATPFRFQVSRRQVIPGWDEGVQLMRLGEKRLLVIPAELAYGTRGQAPRIPRNASLVFEVQLLEITPPKPLPLPKADGGATAK